MTRPFASVVDSGSKPTKADKLRRELYDVLFRAPEALRDGVMSYCARQIADYLAARYTLKPKKKK